jgi:hypothetical protein
MHIGTELLIVWLVIGAVAGGRRYYYSESRNNCAKTSTMMPGRKPACSPK